MKKIFIKNQPYACWFALLYLKDFFESVHSYEKPYLILYPLSLKFCSQYCLPFRLKTRVAACCYLFAAAIGLKKRSQSKLRLLSDTSQLLSCVRQTNCELIFSVNLINLIKKNRQFIVCTLYGIVLERGLRTRSQILHSSTPYPKRLNPNRESCKMCKNLSFLQKEWLRHAKSWTRDTQ